MNKGRISKNGFLLIFIGIVLGAILITVANYIPVRNSIKDLSIAQLESEGSFPEVVSLQGGFGDFHSEKPTTLELATDALILKMALYEGEGEGIKQAFRCYSDQFQEEYSRYWHGYVVLLRPLFLIFDYYEIRIINGICQVMLFLLAAYTIWKRKGMAYLLVFATSYFMLMPLALMYCLQYTWIYYVTFFAIFCCVKYFDFWEKDGRYLYLFLITGILAIYLDLWTYPLLTWGLPALWFVLMQQENSPLEHIKTVVCSGIAWLIGYAGMWMGKWLVGSIILKENLFQRAIQEIFVWTAEKGGPPTTLQERIQAIYLNVKTYSYKLYLLLLMAWLTYGIYEAVRGHIIKSRKSPAFLLIGLSSVAWYFVLADHVTMHHVFTHRIFVISISAFLGTLLVSVRQKETEKVVQSVRMKYLGMIVITGLLAVMMMLQIKETYSRHNGDLSFSLVPVTGTVSMNFIPEHSDITNLQFGLYTENCTTGLYYLQVIDGDTVVEQIMLPVDGTQGGALHDIEVDWKLKKGHPYTLQIDTVDADGDFFIHITENELWSIPEYGMITMKGENMHGQMLAGITYHCRLLETKKQILFIILFWVAGLMMVYSLWSSLDYHKVEESSME